MRWQDINELVKEVFFFKKRSRSRTIWIRGGVVSSFVGMLFYLSLLTGVTIESNGDIYNCGNECVVFINITSTYYRIGLETFPIYFDELDTNYEVFVPARGKGNWRPIKLGKDFIERKNKYNVLPNRFKIIVHKKPWQTIKYGVKIGMEDLDPYLFSENIHNIGGKIITELCEPVYKTWTDKIRHYKQCIVESVYDPINKTNSKAYNYTCLDYIERIEYKDEQVDCIKNGKVNVSNKIYEGNEGYCKVKGTKVICYSNKEGGQYAATERTDKSVDQEIEDLITGEITLISSTGKRFIK